LPPEPLPTWDPEAFFGIFEGFSGWFCAQNTSWLFQKKIVLHDLVTQFQGHVIQDGRTQTKNYTLNKTIIYCGMLFSHEKQFGTL
jgi:hypothetical protein